MSTSDFFNGLDCDKSSEAFYDVAKNHFLALLEMDLDYYGADYSGGTFNVNGVVFKVLEDANDGYRSYLGAIEFTEEDNSSFFRTPLGTVRIETENNYASRLYRLIDTTDSHVWLEFGTDYSDEYYPSFIFSHFPKGAKPVSNNWLYEQD